MNFFDVPDARCNVCGTTNPRFELTEAGPHYGKAVCRSCGQFIDWVAKPTKDEPRIKRTSEDKSLCDYVRGRSERCAFCGRTGIMLEIHHAFPIGDGGPQGSEATLTALCIDCHSLAHWCQRMNKRNGMVIV